MGSFTGKFDSKKQDWATPDCLFHKINKEFQFDLDLAASAENAKCHLFFNKEINGMAQKWEGSCWLNPPFDSKESKVINWIRKAYNDTQADPALTVVMLLPARTNNRYFAEYCMKAAEVRFITGRPKFGDAKHGLPQPLMFVVFKKTYAPTQFSCWSF